MERAAMQSARPDAAAGLQEVVVAVVDLLGTGALLVDLLEQFLDDQAQTRILAACPEPGGECADLSLPFAA